MSYPLSNLPSLDIPSVRALGVLLILYIVIVGPVNFLLLKLKNKLHFAWVTIPTLTVLFALGAFGLAYSLRGNDIMINKLSVIGFFNFFVLLIGGGHCYHRGMRDGILLAVLREITR